MISKQCSGCVRMKRNCTSSLNGLATFPDTLLAMRANYVRYLSTAKEMHSSSPRRAASPFGHEFLSRMVLSLEAEIEDTGVGISDDEIGGMFQYFEQTQSGRKSGTGTGLGLAISRAFVRLMVGDVTVRSRIGHGKCVWLRRIARSPAEPP